MVRKGIKTLFILFIIASLNSNLHAQQKGEVKWYSMEEVQELVKKEPRKIYIDMYTDWCGWCKVMDKNTFTDEKVIDHLNTKFYAVKFDAEGKENVDFKNQTYKFVAQGRNGYHELAAALMQGKMSYPTSVFMDENLNLIAPRPGYLKPEDILPILEFIGDNHYKTINFAQYLEKHSEVNN